MSIFKRGKVYWYHFYFNGQHVQESTKQGNPRIARNMESAHRTKLALGEVGIREREPAPTLSEFIEKRFEPWAKASFEKSSPKTWKDWYRNNLRILRAYAPLAGRKLDAITSEHVAGFAAHRQAQGKQVSTINSSLRVLRRVLNLAIEWGVISSAPKIKLLRGERHRERVVTPQEEQKYLAVAPEPLASIATVLLDSGLRPEECFRLRWESITWNNGKYGSFRVTHGKTPAARRELPMTRRVRAVLESRWGEVGEPDEGWVWTAPTASGHVEPSTIKKQHAKTFDVIAAEAAQNGGKAVRRFVLYSLRHTFLTRLGESGVDVWTLARVAGHSSITMSNRYVHPEQTKILDALSRLNKQKKAARNRLPAGRGVATISATVTSRNNAAKS